MLTQSDIQELWPDIKRGLRNLWGGLSEEELDLTEGDISAVAVMVHDKFNESYEDIYPKLEQLMDSYDNETDKSHYANDRTSWQRSPLPSGSGAAGEVGTGEGNAQSITLHDRDPGDMSGFSEASDDVGIDYDAAKINQEEGRDQGTEANP